MTIFIYTIFSNEIIFHILLLTNPSNNLPHPSATRKEMKLYLNLNGLTLAYALIYTIDIFF